MLCKRLFHLFIINTLKPLNLLDRGFFVWMKDCRFKLMVKIISKGAYQKIMGQIVHIDQIKIEREHQIRQFALRSFPWNEMETIQRYIIEPLIELWPEQVQIIVIEAAFRLAYESFVLGIKEKRKKKKTNADRCYDSESDSTKDQLVQKVINDLLLFRWLNRQKKHSLQIVFQSLSQDWFLRGMRSTLHMD